MSGSVRARNGSVADLGYVGAHPNQMDGVTTLSTESGVTSDEQQLAQSIGRSAYVSQGSTSRYAIGAVIAGLPRNPVQGSYFGLGDNHHWSPFR